MEALEFYNESLRRKFTGNEPIDDLHLHLQDFRQ